ncbi:nucleotidyltransferase domain-containing protein [bacterium]|nr:nucleotidyltransferase domain-containing protein [bacterium]MBU1614493.1 nucleotidyltransferase domain-containing protein [bacterium]
MVDQSILKPIKRLVEVLAEKNIRTNKVILYGSCVEGKNTEYSDIDIAIVSEDFGKNKIEERMLLFRLGSRIDPRLEAIPLTPKAIQEDTWVPLIYEIIDKGIELSITEL